MEVQELYQVMAQQLLARLTGGYINKKGQAVISSFQNIQRGLSAKEVAHRIAMGNGQAVPYNLKDKIGNKKKK